MSDENLEKAEAVTGKKSDWLLELLDWIKYILAAVLIGLLLIIFVIQRNTVIGESMLPNLQPSDQLLVEKVSKYFGGIDYGDIITISTADLEGHEGGTNIIKRVIGKPGDHIAIRDDHVYRNDVLVEESYLAADVLTAVRVQAYSDVLLADNEYYVLGDNRAISKDSRVIGPITTKSIIGEVLLRFYPFGQFGQP